MNPQQTQRMECFALSVGELSISYPDPMTEADVQDVADLLAILLRRLRRHAAATPESVAEASGYGTTYPDDGAPEVTTNAMVCRKCGADRSRVPCGGNLMDCGFLGTAAPEAKGGGR